MRIDRSAAAAFTATHARPLDRRRFALRFEVAEPAGVLAALEAYRNADGGYGWGLEPDFRSAESQPAGAMLAFEALADAAPATTRRAAELCDWLQSVTLPDGGLPLVLPFAQKAGTVPRVADVDPGVSSLMLTAGITGNAHRVARHDPAVARHPWLERATRFCLDGIAARDEPGSAYELLFSLMFLAAVGDVEPGAAPLLGRCAAAIPASGTVHVTGGAEGEFIRPLDFAPDPNSPVRPHIASDVIAADLERLSAGQRDDGGWRFDHVAHSPAANLEWRGYYTVRALTILRAYGSLAFAA